MAQSPRAVKLVVPRSMRKLIRKSTAVLKKHVPIHTGVLPDFLIIGAQKCGTTSLYNYLIQHPCIHSASIKEIGFFDQYLNYCKGIRWYRSHFPSLFRRYFFKYVLRQEFITGEASTSYILNPHALKRISEIVPHAKLILLLRNPIDRAYSHYQHSVRSGRENLSFEDAIRIEKERTGENWKGLKDDETSPIDDIDHYGYLSTGIYADQVKVLMDIFAMEQVLILASEELFMNPSVVLQKVLDFLNMPRWELKEFEKFNAGEYLSLEITTRKILNEYFKPYNQRLYAYVGRYFDWDEEENQPNLLVSK